MLRLAKRWSHLATVLGDGASPRFWARGRSSMTAIKPANLGKVRTETDTFGPIEVAADKYWGAQAQRSLGNFKIGWEKQPQADRARARHRQARRRRDQHGARPARPEDRRGHRRGRAGGDRGQARRPFPAGRLADRLGHAVEHERQRGDLQPRHRDAGRRDGLQEARASQRPRQHEPVVERHLSDGHAHRLRGGDRSTGCCRRCSTCTRRSTPRRRRGRTSSRSAARTRRTPRR